MRTPSLRTSLLVGLFSSLAACSGSSTDDSATDEGALEEERAEADARRSASEITEIRCDVDGFLGKDVALSKQSYKKLPADYESKSAAEKQQILWANVAETAYPSACRPDGGFGFIGKSILSLIKGGLDQTWVLASDEMPEGRVKFLRPFGTTASFEMESVASTPYTGVLKRGGTVKGMMRFSNVGAEDKSGFVPGIAFKFLVDGKPSVNTVAMYSMLPQRVNHEVDRNFFRYPLRNWFPSVAEQAKIDHGGYSLKTQITQLIFENSFGSKPNRMEVDELAKVEASGREVPAAERKFPRNLEFKPAAALTQMYQDALARDPQADYRDVLKKLEPGTVMYDVVGYEDENPSSRGVKVGVVRLTSKILPSAWADFRLFFKHSAKNSKHENEY